MKSCYPLVIFGMALGVIGAAAQTSPPSGGTNAAPNELSDAQAAARTGVRRVYVPPLPANPRLPTLWLIGDSTVRNGTLGDGSNMNQWGWGAPLESYFNTNQINVVNRALGGTSSLTFYNTRWINEGGVRELLKRGDFLILQFGHNDAATPKGIGDETSTGRGGETVHTFGWYLKQYVEDARAKGVTAVVCSLIPRRRWDPDGRIHRDADTYGGWASQVAQAEKVGFIDLNELIARRYDTMSREAVTALFVPTPTETVHTGWAGAEINAEIVVSGLKALSPDPLASFYSAKGNAVPAAR